MEKKIVDIVNALYVVPTPIGNMQDITYRAVEVLRNVDIICAEDTRHSMPLLENLGVASPRLISFHDHNETEKATKIADLIEDGHSVAIISDAGTPLVSDPGFHLVKECVSRNIKVIPLPGPCAMITALCACGMPTDRFTFEGFLPVKEKALRDKFESLVNEERTMIFYEAPRRILDTAKILGEIYPNRDVMVARELTKTFETFYYSKGENLVNELIKDPNIEKGEMVVVLAPNRENNRTQDLILPSKLLSLLVQELPMKKACGIVAELFNLRKNDLYKQALDLTRKND